MSKVNVTTNISVEYDEESIRQLIVEDLFTNHKIRIEPSELKIKITGGHLDREDDYYSGGRITSEPRVVPPAFHGFSLNKIVK